MTDFHRIFGHTLTRSYFQWRCYAGDSSACWIHGGAYIVLRYLRLFNNPELPIHAVRLRRLNWLGRLVYIRILPALRRRKGRT